MGNTVLDKNISWNKKEYNNLLKYLDSIKDEDYKEFNEKVVFTKYKILGIKVPVLRKIAKSISKTDYMKLYELTNYENYEITLILGILISYINDFDLMKSTLFKYSPHIDNWAICDILASSLKIFKTKKDIGLNLINTLLKSEHEYDIRLALVLLLNYYNSCEYLDTIFNIIKNINKDTYYINMATSWLLQVCYLVDKDRVYNFLKNNNVSDFVLRKTISKINDSFKIKKEDKIRMKTLLS